MVESLASMLRVRPGERPAGENVVVQGFPALDSVLAKREKERQRYDTDFLPVYVMPGHVDQCKRSLEWLQEMAEVINAST